VTNDFSTCLAYMLKLLNISGIYVETHRTVF